jgi:hypothetical protein
VPFEQQGVVVTRLPQSPGKRHIEETLQACARGADPANIRVALQIVLQAERVPYTREQK